MSNEENNIKQQEIADDSILIEFTRAGQGGTVPVAWFSLGRKPDLAKKSNEAMEKAMDTIRKMADKVNSNIQTIQNKPSSIEMEFGIKFDAEVGAIVAKVTAEASMTVKLVWNNADESLNHKL
jgi:hypothetical protein